MSYLLIVKRCEPYEFSVIRNKYYYFNLQRHDIIYDTGN